MVVGTWSNRYVDNMTGQERENYYYITFNEDGTGIAQTRFEPFEILWEIVGTKIYTYITMEKSLEGYGLLYSSEPYTLYEIYNIHPGKNKLVEETNLGFGANIYSKE